jgi:hypothetical protein
MPYGREAQQSRQSRKDQRKFGNIEFVAPVVFQQFLAFLPLRKTKIFSKMIPEETMTYFLFRIFQVPFAALAKSDHSDFASQTLCFQMPGMGKWRIHQNERKGGRDGR